MEEVSCRSPFKGGEIVGRELGKHPLCLGPYTSRLAKSAPLVRLRDVYLINFFSTPPLYGSCHRTSYLNFEVLAYFHP